MMQWYATYLDALKTGMQPNEQQAFAQRVNVVPSRLAIAPHSERKRGKIAA